MTSNTVWHCFVLPVQRPLELFVETKHILSHVVLGGLPQLRVALLELPQTRPTLWVQGVCGRAWVQNQKTLF